MDAGHIRNASSRDSAACVFLRSVLCCPRQFTKTQRTFRKPATASCMTPYVRIIPFRRSGRDHTIYGGEYIMENDYSDQTHTTGDPAEQSRDLRLRNQVKKMELAARYGARFSDDNSGIPPEIEGGFLDHIMRFEEEWRNNVPVRLRDFLGNPHFPPVLGIPDEQLEEELERVFDVLELNDVAVDFLCDVGLRERYRFITEELLGEEMNNVRIPGMCHHFVYEDFHPNMEYDAKSDAEHFLCAIFHTDADIVSRHFVSSGVLTASGSPLTRQAAANRIFEFQRSFAALQPPRLTFRECVLAGDRAIVNYRIFWSGEIDPETPPVQRRGLARIHLVLEEDRWYVERYSIPGVNEKE